MKKQNNISLRIIKQTFYTLLVILCCASCTEEFLENDASIVKEGVPVSINLQFKASSLNKITTRALTDEAEFKVNDLYLLIFDSKGNRKAGSKYYSSDDLNVTNGNQAEPTTGSITGIKTTSGKSYIYGVANAVNSELDGAKDSKMLDQLNKVNSIDELKAIVAILNSAGNVARSTATLLMSGAFEAASGNSAEEGECVIPTTDASINGTLKLRRLDSHITFKIELGDRIQSAEFESWQVFNVPTNSYLIDQKEQCSASYSNSGVQATFSKVASITSFDFYMQENLKESIAGEDGSELKLYKDREKEYKEPNTNTGRYKYVEENATFVEIKGKLNIKLDNENALRTADVKYTIHLGGGETDFKNFNSLRNAKYTYTVTINDVNSIIVEVENSEEHEDARPGAEGNVVDASAETIILDSHYNCFNLGFTYDEIVNNLSFIIETPFAPNAVYSVNKTLTNTPKGDGDYKWIQFLRTGGIGALAKYNARGTKLLSIYDLVDDMKNRTNEGDTRTYYYTVFINEYYYNEAPTTATESTWRKEPLWSNFVNKEDRKLLLFLGTEYSDDKESSYSKAKYLIRQKSIQTYYSTEVFNDTKTALGMEHVNETGAPNWNNLDISDLSNKNGFANTNKYFGPNWSRKQWSTYIDYSISESYPYTYKMKDVAAIAECLSRNRDENGDNKIDKDEMKWYLPATDQLVSMFLGAKSMPSPMFDDSSIGEVTYDDGNNHYITSNKQKIWAEEGCSFGEISTYNDKKYPKNLRCVRNLGLSNESAVTNTVGKAYTYNATNRVFVMDQLKEQNKRSGIIEPDLVSHHNFDDTNRPYKAFQVAKNFINENKYTTWEDFFNINGRSKCSNYTENRDAWRAPNQREFMIMFLEDVNLRNGEYDAFSSTHWKYNTKRHFGINKSFLFLDGNRDFTEPNYKRTIRCVRDVEADVFGNITK